MVHAVREELDDEAECEEILSMEHNQTPRPVLEAFRFRVAFEPEELL